MRVVKILVCLEWRKVCIVLPALLNTARISNTSTSNAQNIKVAMAPELHPELLRSVYITCHGYRALSPDYKSFYDFFRSDSLIEYHNISSIFSSAHSCSNNSIEE